MSLKKIFDEINKTFPNLRPWQENFDQFWKSYPKKVGKGAAFKAWRKHKCESISNRVTESIGPHKTCDMWTKEDGRYIPNPATFLNQRRWEDEPVTTDDDAWMDNY